MISICLITSRRKGEASVNIKSWSDFDGLLFLNLLGGSSIWQNSVSQVSESFEGAVVKLMDCAGQANIDVLRSIIIFWVIDKTAWIYACKVISKWILSSKEVPEYFKRIALETITSDELSILLFGNTIFQSVHATLIISSFKCGIRQNLVGFTDLAKLSLIGVKVLGAS